MSIVARRSCHIDEYGSVPIRSLSVRRFSVTISTAFKWRAAATLPAIAIIVVYVMSSPELWTPVAKGPGARESMPAWDLLFATASFFAGWLASYSSLLHELLSHVEGWGYRRVSSDAGQATVILGVLRYGCLLLLWFVAYSVVARG